MNTRHTAAGLLLALLASAPAIEAKVTLPAVFTDNLVLQQNSNARLWGKAEGKKVTVTTSWDKKSHTATVDSDGRWQIEVPTPGAGFDAQSITLSDGKGAPATINDVLIGEVWICSGQSNMEEPLKGFYSQDVVGSQEAILSSGRYRDKVRFVTVDRTNDTIPRFTFGGAWAKATPQSAQDCSATAWFYGTTLADALGVPVGLIINSWGGSQIESWMSRELLDSLGIYYTDDEKKKSTQHQQTMLRTNMLCPIMGYTAKGIIWYQGESNLHNSAGYAKMQQAMVDEWRREWQDAEMPFYYVLIAPYSYGNVDGLQAPLLREQQLLAAKQIPHSGLISTLNIGDRDGIHPTQKREVGQRLAALALNKTYGMTSLTPTGPMMTEVKIKSDTVFVTFDKSGNGLQPQRTPLGGFEVAGADSVFHAAQAQVVFRTNTVSVRSDSVAAPRFVRYAFRNFPQGVMLTDNLGNAAFPFRTDSIVGF